MAINFRLCKKFLNHLNFFFRFYCEHYAPFVSDLKNFHDVDMHFPLAKPFKPFEQLLAVLPARSKAILPETYRSLMTEGAISEFYPSEFKLDLNGKQMDWEAVVLIPFIDEVNNDFARAPLV